MISSIDTFSCRRTLSVGGKDYTYFSLAAAEENGLAGLQSIPYSLKVLVENLLRNEDGNWNTADSIVQLAGSVDGPKSDISFFPARVLMQDFTGVPAIADLAAMRDAAVAVGTDPNLVNPKIPVDLVIDHSVMVDRFGDPKAFGANIRHEYTRNAERYRFLRWGQAAFDNFRVVPPGTGICHQVNLEYLASVVKVTETSGEATVFPDTVVGTDSHTTMVNALAVLGWGVGGIEAEAAMLGQPISMLVPEVVGFQLEGKMPEGSTATDLVLRIVEILRNKGVVGKFVEFYGSGLDNLTVEDRSTIANMAPEYGATCGYFPIDEDTISYLRSTNRDKDHIDLVEAYARAQGMFRQSDTPVPSFADSLSLDLSSIRPAVSGPKRPQDRLSLKDTSTAVSDLFLCETGTEEQRVEVRDTDFDIGNGDIAIAAITSCTNTSNPAVLIAAGLLAKRAVERGLVSKPWVKTSLAPGSQVVTDYLNESGLSASLDALGFSLVGYGCTTCIGNSGPLLPAISEAVKENNLTLCAVLSGNRNFEGRINADVRANFIGSPPLVVAYAIAGTMLCNITKDPLGFDSAGEAVYLRDIWPSDAEVAELVRTCVRPEMFARRYGEVFKGDENWQGIEVRESAIYPWDEASTYIQRPPYFDAMTAAKSSGEKGGVSAIPDLRDARILALFGDSITTDHISPAGSFSEDQPAGAYLLERQVRASEFNSYGSRRGNHHVMMRGTFANIRIKNLMTPGVEGGFTVHYPGSEQMEIFAAAQKYQEENVPLVVMAGKEYGTGSSRDWAAKGSMLLGVRAVVAESFERIHRSNLIGMGILPLVFEDGDSWNSLGITGKETISIDGIADIEPGSKLGLTITAADGTQRVVSVTCRIDTAGELSFYRSGGILPFMLGELTA